MASSATLTPTSKGLLHGGLATAFAAVALGASAALGVWNPDIEVPLLFTGALLTASLLSLPAALYFTAKDKKREPDSFDHGRDYIAGFVMPMTAGAAIAFAAGTVMFHDEPQLHQVHAKTVATVVHPHLKAY